MQSTFGRVGALSVLTGVLGIAHLPAGQTAPAAKTSTRASNEILVYSWTRAESPSDILRIDPETSASTNLTQSKEWEFDPVWSPDRTRIAFAALRHRMEDRTNIYVMDADGSHRRSLTPGVPNRLLGSPAWSPDGKRIAFHSVHLDKSAHGFLFPEIYVVDLQGTTPRKIAQGLAPSWSPDGKSLLFLKVYGETRPQEGIWRVNADGSGARRVVKAPLELSASATWSPDGKRIAYVGGVGDEYGIYVVGAEGSNPTQLNHARQVEEEFTGLQWSSDGRRLFFTRTITSELILPDPEKTAVFRMDADGTHVKQLAAEALTGGGVFGTICAQMRIILPES